MTTEQIENIALAAVGRDDLEATVYEKLPEGCEWWCDVQLPEEFWYVCCTQKEHLMVDGPEWWVCISKATGKIIYRK